MSDEFKKLQEAYQNAIDNLKSNKDGGRSNAVSLAYDSGYVEGIRHALEIVEKLIVNSK